MSDLPDSYTRLSWGERGRICELLTKRKARPTDVELADRLIEEIRGTASGGRPQWLAEPEHREALTAWLVEAGVPERVQATVDTVGNDPNSAYLRIFELVCRGPRHEARRLIRALDDGLVAALADRLAVTAQLIHEERHT